MYLDIQSNIDRGFDPSGWERPARPMQIISSYVGIALSDALKSWGMSWFTGGGCSFSSSFNVSMRHPLGMTILQTSDPRRKDPCIPIRIQSHDQRYQFIMAQRVEVLPLHILSQVGLHAIQGR